MSTLASLCSQHQSKGWYPKGQDLELLQLDPRDESPRYKRTTEQGLTSPWTRSQENREPRRHTQRIHDGPAITALKRIRAFEAEIRRLKEDITTEQQRLERPRISTHIARGHVKEISKGRSPLTETPRAAAPRPRATDLILLGKLKPNPSNGLLLGYKPPYEQGMLPQRTAYNGRRTKIDTRLLISQGTCPLL